jgi:hypothetical protein
MGEREICYVGAVIVSFLIACIENNAAKNFGV